MKMFSHQVFGLLDLVVPGLAREGRPIGYNGRDAESLEKWFISLWYLIRSSVPLMEAARSELLARHSDEPFTGELVDYFERHIDEERDHDSWLLQDIERLGRRADELTTTMAPVAIAELAGSQHYYIRHHHPVTLLGYIALAEGYAPKPSWIDGLAAESSAPPETWRTYRLHSTEDVAHKEELGTLLDALPEKPSWHRRSVLSNAVRSAYGWGKALEAIAKSRIDTTSARATSS